ncbi:sacsin-like [Mercenaria mercenaria]|uniref:sacsin-like n=1 Tax=Mercenaria mercenaria TaxID=6596 RepID=UPI00234F1759|nr:sacsin-like [Mercenaria mercenaria]
MCDRYQQDTLQFNMSAVNSGSDTEDYSGVDEPTLLEKFRRILDQYRNDVQIIKELVQNADDATATKLKILYDGRNINKEETGENPYRKFLRGPALAFFNDAKFSEKDWKGIKSINKSIKKDAPLKIGQFGLGFKSIFHLTDYPCIISGDRLLFLNPQEKNENKICTTVKLRKIRKGKHHETRDYLNALDGIFGFSDESFDSGFSEGTIFWFPLRQTPSGLSDSIYTDSQVYDLLQSFLNEAHRSLIFLQTLCDIELFVNLPQMDDRMNVFNTELLNMNYGKDTPCFKTQIDNKDKNLVHIRKAVLKELEETAGEILKTSKDWVHDVEITIYTKCKTSGEKVAKSRWLVVNYLKGGEISKGTTDLMNIDNCKISHLVGFAASINEQNDYTNADGHVFCYQPLPQEYEHMTGLPVHVNGFFALSQDRRHIRWPDHEDTAHGERKVQWNIALTNEIMPDGYCRLFEEMITLCKYENNPVHMVSAVYHTFPDFPCVKHPWKNMAEMSLAKSTDIELAFTNNSGGRWIRPFEAVFVDRRIDTGLDVDCLNTIINLLLRDEVNVVVVSDLVLKAFERTFSDMKYLTPLFLKTHLLNNHVYKVLSPSEKEDILQFVLQDSTTDCLDKLELLPLADGTFTDFSSTVFLEGKDIIDLFPGHSKKFISPHIRTMTREQLCSLSENCKDVTCIHTLSDAATVSLIEDILRSDFNVKDQYRNYIRTDAFTIYKFEEWLKTVWTLIQSRFRKSIGMFICLPIFPVYHELKGTSQLSVHSLKVPTLQVSSLMNRDDKDHVFISFQLLSIAHFDSIPRWIDSGLITQYIHTETSDGLVALLSKIDDESIQYFNQKTSPEISSALLKYLSEGIHFKVGEECKRKVYSLKLFTAYLSAEENELVCLEQQNGIYNGRRFPVRFPDKTIVLYSVTEIAFAERIEANFISEYDLVSTSLNKINVYPYTDREKLIRWIIKEEKYLEDELIRNCIIKTEFLVTEDGKVHMPQCLFDPTDKILANVFKNQHSIALVDDNNFQYISGLRRLGLKSRKDLGIEDIERQCDVVHEMAMGKTALIKEQCQSLLVIMNDMPDLINLERLSKKCCIFLEDLNECNRKSNVQIPSKLRKNPVQICLPMEIKSMEFSALISSVSYTIDCDLWPNLSKVFCWSESPNVEDVANQLLNIVKIYEIKLKPALLPIITNIYEWFAQQDRHDIKLILERLFSSLDNTFVWVGNGFRAPNQTYVERNESDTDMQPFAHLLPDEVQHLSEFFIHIGCRKCFSFEMLVSTLYQIKHGIDRGTKYEVSSEKQMLRIVVNILKKIKQEHLEEFLISNKELYFPIVCSEEKSIELKPTNECTFCDAEWLRHVELKKVSGIYYVHPDVPISTAEALGVPPLTRQMLSDAEAFEEWGQEEPLTRRLRTLLKDGYVDGFSIVKELFQNADDARANKLWIMYDERENNDARSNLLSEKLAELQGPAIWIYNEAKFNSDDLNNIRKLYGETKKEDATKIGKFGLGFCAVYNVTDVPSFVTGSHFVIFDPHTTFLGKALEGKRPGLKINLNGNLIDLFRNQFKPFESVFGCKLTNCTPYFDGTLFRLPLRNRASDISDTVYTSSQVKELFAKIMSLSANMLIFNQHIHEIKIFHTPKSENDPAKSRLLFKLSKKTISLTRNFHSTESIVSEVAKRKEENSLRGNPLMSLEKIEITGERHYDGHFKQYRRKNLITGTWLVSWSTGTNDNFFTLSYKEKGALPIGAVAVPIKFRKGNRELEFLSLKDVERNFYKSGHLFFFLPLPIEHRFPFHINGQFSITSDRRQVRTSNEDDINVQMKNWNENLLKDPVTQSLLCLLENVNHAGKVVNYNCYQLWPRDETAALLRCFTQSFYEKVVLSNAFKVFEKNGQWFDISECVFIDSRLRSSDVGKIIFEFLSLLTINVVDVPEDVYQMLLKAGEKLMQSKSVSENAFFLNYFLPNLEQFGKDLAMTEKRNKLLCHAIQLREGSINEWVMKNPCIPSRPHSILKSPTAMIDSRSQLAVMFEEADNMFPEKIFEEEIIRAHLHELGLMNDVLTDDVLLDRAKSIKEKQKQCDYCAFERSGHILLYMNDKREQHGDIIQELQQIEFIPIKSKSECWPFKWYADVTDRSGKHKMCLIHKYRKQHSQHSQFIRASDMYHNDCRNLVGTLQFVFAEDVCYCTSGMRKYDAKELKAMLKKIGMKGLPRKDVDFEIVSQQLQLILADWNDRTDNTGSQEVKNIVVDIYKHLNLLCKNETVSNKIRTMFGSRKVVWISNTFVSPKNVATTRNQMDCTPYLFKLSASPLNGFKPLCKCLGITEYFEPNYVAMTLRNIHTGKGNTRLTGTEIRTVINILHCLNESMQVKKKGDINYTFDDKPQTIYGPDDEGILRDMKQMCFNDFLPMVKSTSMIYSHDLIPKALAEAFGVKPKKLHYLEEDSEDIEDFCQEEPLVVRLSRLVENYPCDNGIFKELIQNADDAQATEIHFLKDYVTHPVTNILDKTFAPLQGPALCVFNNSAFTKEDLSGIKRLGVGSKSDDPLKAGRYGVGFNAVYNMTDAPSLYTKGPEIENGDTLCFFDPLAKFVPNVIRKKPGKRYKRVDKVRQYQSDVMKGYHEDFFMKKNKTVGTVFRLPLRTSDMAKSSDIKQKSIDMKTVSEMLDSLCKDLKDVLLFLKNLKTIRVSSYEQYGYVEDYVIDVQMTETDAIEQKKFVAHQTELCRDLKTTREKVFQLKQVHAVYELQVKETIQRKEEKHTTVHNKEKTYMMVQKKEEKHRMLQGNVGKHTTVQKKEEKHTKYIVVQAIGFKQVGKIPYLVHKEYLKGKIGLLPHGGVALCIENTSKSYGHINADNTKNKAFCFLPLPVDTGLPVNVHGYFSLDHETRRGLWKSEHESKCYRTLWNLTLIEQVIAPAYVFLLEYTKKQMFQEVMSGELLLSTVTKILENFQTLFPVIESTYDYYWKHLLKCVYQSLVSEYIPFLPVLETTKQKYLFSTRHYRTTILSWTPLKPDGFTFPAYVNPESTTDEKSKWGSDFNNMLRAIGIRITTVPKTMMESMAYSKVSINPLEVKHVVDFLCSIMSSSLDKCKIETNKHVSETVFKSEDTLYSIANYCLEDVNYFISNCRQLPLMMTQDSIVHTLQELEQGFMFVDESGLGSTLFPHNQSMFLHVIMSRLIKHQVDGYESKTENRLKQFTLQQFVNLVSETSQLRPDYAAVTPWDQKEPSAFWIKTFWNFFRHFLPLTGFPEKEVMTGYLQMVQMLPLIPAIEKAETKKYLVKPVARKLLIDMESFANNECLYKALKGLKLLEIDMDALQGKIPDSVHPVYTCLLNEIPNFSNAEDIVHCLHLNLKRLSDSNIAPVQAIHICQYFNGYLPETTMEIRREMLSELPIFVTHFNRCSSIKRYTKVYVAPLDMPADGLEEVATDANILMLQNIGTQILFQKLNILRYGIKESYANVIIPNKDRMRRASFYKHLEFLADIIKSESDEMVPLITMLMNTHLIDTEEGYPRAVKDLYYLCQQKRAGQFRIFFQRMLTQLNNIDLIRTKLLRS